MATVVTPVPYIMRNYSMEITTFDFVKQTSGVLLTPSSSTITWVGGQGFSASFPGATSWTCQIDYAQDWVSTQSLSRFLLEHAGETVTAVFRPQTPNGGPTFTLELNIAPGAAGGTVDQVATASVTLGVNGTPVAAYPTTTPTGGGSGS